MIGKVHFIHYHHHHHYNRWCCHGVDIDNRYVMACHYSTDMSCHIKVRERSDLIESAITSQAAFSKPTTAFSSSSLAVLVDRQHVAVNMRSGFSRPMKPTTARSSCTFSATSRATNHSSQPSIEWATTCCSKPSRWAGWTHEEDEKQLRTVRSPTKSATGAISGS